MPAKRVTQRKQATTRQQATKKPQRGFRAAPPRLREIIELVNYVRPADELPPIEYNPPPLGEDSTAFVKYKWAELEAKTKGLPVRFLKYVFPKAKPGQILFIAFHVQRYEFVRECRENLRLIARSARLPFVLIPLRSTLYVVRNRDTGELTMVSDKFRAALDEDGVKLDCIRECGVCGRVYYEDRLVYQGKLTKPACLDHGGAIRSRHNYRPVKTDAVEAFLTENPDLPRTVESIKDGIEATERQIKLALDYLKRKEAG